MENIFDIIIKYLSTIAYLAVLFYEKLDVIFFVIVFPLLTTYVLFSFFKQNKEIFLWRKITEKIDSREFVDDNSTYIAEVEKLTTNSNWREKLDAKNFQVFVDDNFHYMEEDERITANGYDTAEEAIECCKNMVDDFLIRHYQPGMTTDILYDYYTSFGEDPFIGSKDENVECEFSAWNYAKMRSAEMCKDE